MPAPKRTRRLLVWGSIVALVLGLHYVGWIAPVESSLRSIILFPFNIFFGARITDTPLTQCLAQLEDVASLRAKTTELSTENAELRSQLNYKPKKEFTAIGATVVGHDIDSAAQVLLVDRGTHDGVAVGKAILSGAGIFVGKIIKSDASISWIQLISDAQSTVGARVLNKEQSLGVVEGGYGLSLRMKFIPRNEVVKVGDQVVTSGLEDTIPAGMVIGTVTAVENEAYQPFQEAIITPAVTFGRLQQVRVVTTF